MKRDQASEAAGCHGADKIRKNSLRSAGIILLTVAAILLLGMVSFASASEQAEMDEWTVMIYFCGSNLESKYSYASENLGEICEVYYPFDESKMFNENFSLEDGIRDNLGKVNILIETGGSREWHAQDLGMNIDADSLQRWQYHYYVKDVEDLYDTFCFELMETLPLQSMSDPETLADFVRWGAETCPARKYALVLWGHGNAAKGIFHDELINGDMMYLYELKQALTEGGVHLDTLILDACLMSNLETAWNVKDHADYMVASEEVVPGTGTAFREWLNALVSHPSLDGKWLAKCVCDLTNIKYASIEDEKSKSLLTWSVTDLSQIDHLISACGDYFRNVNDSLKEQSQLFILLIRLMTAGETYGEDRQRMIDLGSTLFYEDISYFVDPEILDPIIEALSKAEIYVSRGQGRSRARGLTFCFPVGFSEEDLDIYAKNFPMPEYLALLDAVSSWTAPEYIYTQTERLPEVSDIERYHLKGQKTHTESGMPALTLSGPFLHAYYNLYRFDEETGETVLLGQTECGANYIDNDVTVFPTDPMHWPTLEGTLCCIELVQSNVSELLYNIPVQMDTETAMLRCGRKITYTEDEIRNSSYTVYGIWDGYDETSELLSRSVTPLAMVAGRNYCVLYPRDNPTEDGKISYLKSEEKTMYRSLRITEAPLPVGTYYLESEVADVFMNVTRTDRIEIHWDGKAMTFPDDASWTGSIN